MHACHTEATRAEIEHLLKYTKYPVVLLLPGADGAIPALAVSEAAVPVLIRYEFT